MAAFLASQLCFGLFIKPLEDEFGWSRAAVSGAVSLSLGVAGLVGVPLGRLSDRYNVVFTIAFGTVVGAGSYLLLRTTDSLWQLYVYFGVGMGICAGCCYAPVTATISKWFKTRTTLALGIAMSGIVLGQMVIAPVLGSVIERHGWRAGSLFLAAITLGLGALGLALMARKPKTAETVERPDTEPVRLGTRPVQGYTTREAVKTAPFWMLIITGLTMGAGFYIVITHIVPCAVELGISAAAAALILTMNAVGSLVGTLLAGWFSSMLGEKRTFAWALLGQAVTVLLFLATRDTWSFFLVSGLFGFCFAVSAPVRFAMVAPLFGLKSIGSILGCATLAWSAGGVLSPYLSGYVHDRTGSYTWVFVGGCVVLLIGAASVYLWGSHKEERQAWA